MNPTNGNTIQDPEKFSALAPTTSVDDIRLLKESEVKERKQVKMQKLRRLLFTALVLAVLTAGVVCSSPHRIHQRDRSPPVKDDSVKEFQELLNTIEPASLHEILHEHLKDKYQHGVYQEDRTAMEVVHQEDAETARSLIDLMKRQAASTNGSVVTTTPISTTVDTVTQGTTSTVQPSSTVVIQGSTSSAPTVSQATTSVVQTSTIPGPSQSASNSSPQDSTATAPIQVVSSTSDVIAASTTTAGPKTTTKAGSSDSSGPSLSTLTTASDSPTATGSTPGASSTQGSQSPSTDDSSSSITHTVVYHTTFANGAVSTVTSVTVVPGQAGEISGTSSTKTGANASLQTNGVNQKSFGMNVVAGALGLAAMAAL